jgi:hypothetical protein
VVGRRGEAEGIPPPCLPEWGQCRQGRGKSKAQAVRQGSTERETLYRKYYSEELRRLGIDA